MPGRRINPWCGGRFGYRHQKIIVRPDGPPCGPPPSWYADSVTATEAAAATADGWVCFHREVCSRCPRILRASLRRAECPDAHGQRGD